MKVLYFQHPGGGGSMLGLYEMLRLLDITRIEPVVVSYFDNQYTRMLENIIGVRVIFLNAEQLVAVKQPRSTGLSILNIILLQIFAIRRYFVTERKLYSTILSILEKEKPDLVHHFNDIIDNRQSVRACNKAGIRQIIYYHTLSGYRYNLVDYIIDSLLIRKVNFHMFMTNVVRDHFTRLFNISADKSALYNDVVDPEKFSPSRVKVNVRLGLGIAKDDFVIADIGRIIPWKGQDILIQAINLIKDRVSNVKVLIVGPWDKAVGSEQYYLKLKEMTENYGLKNIVIFTGNRDDISDLINESNLIVHTAVKPEPQGIIILEALLCHKPVIASDSGGSAELIRKYGGLLVKPGDPVALADLLVQVYTGRSDISALFHFPSKYEQLISDFNPENKLRELINIYDKVLA